MNERESFGFFVTTLHGLCATTISLILATSAAAASRPNPLGTLVDLGGHKLHVRCNGKGIPTVVVENGLGDFSFDWVLVQMRVSRFSRICTYDRAGYAWSDPGPKPRTFAQLNLIARCPCEARGAWPVCADRTLVWRPDDEKLCHDLSS